MSFVAETLNVNGAYLSKLFGLQVKSIPFAVVLYQ